MKAAYLNRILIVLTMACTVLLCACQPKVFGVAYVDDNANLSMDPTESRLSYAKYIVTFENETVAEGVTDSDGSFIVKAEKPGYYCAEVTADSSFASSGKALTAPVEKGVASDVDTDNDGVKDDVDNCVKIANASQIDTDSDGFGDACDLCPETANDDSDGDGKADSCGDSNIVEDKAPTVEAGKSCINVKGRSVEMNVPVARDYSAAISTLPSQETVTMFAGEPVTVKFIYPAACNKFDIVTLDPILQSAQIWITTAQAGASVLNLNSIVSSPATVGAYMGTRSADSPVTASFPLIADPAFIGEKDVTVRIRATCPDGDTRYMLEKKVKVTGRYPVEASCSLPNLPAPTATKIVLKCEVKNISEVDLGDVELRAGVRGYYSLLSINLTAGLGNAYKCDKYGSYGLCVFALDAKEKFTFEFTFDISSREGEFVSYANTTIVDRPDLEPRDVKDAATWNPPAVSQ